MINTKTRPKGPTFKARKTLGRYIYTKLMIYIILHQNHFLPHTLTLDKHIPRHRLGRKKEVVFEPSLVFERSK